MLASALKKAPEFASMSGGITLVDVMSDDFYFEERDDSSGVIGGVVTGVRTIFSFGEAYLSSVLRGNGAPL